MVVWVGLTNSWENKRSESQRRKGKIYPSECRVPKNSNEESFRFSNFRTEEICKAFLFLPSHCEQVCTESGCVMPGGPWCRKAGSFPEHASHVPSPGCRRCCCCSVAKSCPTLCDPMGCSVPVFPVLLYLPEFAQTHVHWVGDVILAKLKCKKMLGSGWERIYFRIVFQTWINSQRWKLEGR